MLQGINLLSQTANLMHWTVTLNLSYILGSTGRISRKNVNCSCNSENNCYLYRNAIKTVFASVFLVIVKKGFKEKDLFKTRDAQHSLK